MVIQKEIASGSPLSVKELCEMTGVSRSGYYRYISAEENRIRRESQDLSDFLLIKEAYEYRGYDKGYRGIYMRLKRIGIIMNTKKVRRLMRKYGLMCPIREANPYRRMAKEMRTNSVAENVLNRDFRKYGARMALLTDITYIRCKGEHFYLSVIKDAFTEEVLAYKLSDSMAVDFVLETVNMLISEHGSELYDGTMLHSDQGCHYTSVSYRKLLTDMKLLQSMSRKGNCWDNAPQESFFGHMKDELKPYAKSWKTFEDVKKRIDDWIDYYNNERYQMGLKQMAPTEYYRYITTGEKPTEGV